MSHTQTTHWAFNDDQFEQQFRSGSFPVRLFNHEAHLRLAWIHLTKYGLEQAKQSVADDIRHFVHLAGATDKYHHTLTVAAIEVVNHFQARSGVSTFQELIDAHPRLLHNFKGLIDTHYSSELIWSEEARKVYQEPDKASFHL